MKCECGAPVDPRWSANLCLKCYKRIVNRAFWPKALKEAECPTATNAATR